MATRTKGCAWDRVSPQCISYCYCCWVLNCVPDTTLDACDGALITIDVIPGFIYSINMYRVPTVPLSVLNSHRPGPKEVCILEEKTATNYLPQMNINMYRKCLLFCRKTSHTAPAQVPRDLYSTRCQGSLKCLIHECSVILAPLQSKLLLRDCLANRRYWINICWIHNTTGVELAMKSLIVGFGNENLVFLLLSWDK